MANKRSELSFDALINRMHSFTSEPDRFLAEQPQLTEKVKVYTKNIYDSLKQNEPPDENPNALPELIIDKFDDEQIWQEIELHNSYSVNQFISSVSKILAAKDRLTFTDEIPSKLEQDSEILDESVRSDEESESDDNDDSDDDLAALHPDNNDEDSDSDLERLLDKAEAGELSDDADEEDDSESRTLADKMDSDSRSRQTKKSNKKSAVDDQFFKLSEMEEFLTQEDQREERRMRGLEEDEEDEDEDEDDDDDEGQNIMYSDYFGGVPPPPSGANKKKVSFAGDDDGDDDDDDDNDDDGDDNANDNDRDARKRKLLDSDSESEGEDADEILGRKPVKSSFEERQQKMKKKIQALEAANLEEKSWQMTGEVGGAGRPENSLLAEDLDFDHTSKLPPTITQETTMKLEDIIVQRIKDKAFDDVERKVKTKEDPFEYKKRITLSQEKSKQSLSEIYAQEYMKQNESEDKEKERDPKHEEIEKMMQSLFLKLDALSNFHFTPKPAIPEVKVVTNMPTISMEEVAPVSVSDAQLLAPEEVKDKQRGLEIGQTERTDTDKLRQRRQKKADKRKRVKEKEKRQKLVEKANPGLGNKYSKEKALKQLEKDAQTQQGVTVIKDKSSANKNVSSKQFFQQLQDEVTTQIQSKKSSKNKKKESRKSSQNFML